MRKMGLKKMDYQMEHKGRSCIRLSFVIIEYDNFGLTVFLLFYNTPSTLK